MKGYGENFKWHQAELYFTPTEETMKRRAQMKPDDKSRLVPLKFKPYQIGEISPKGWVSRLMNLYAEGIGGQLDTFWPSIKESRWVGGFIQNEIDPIDNMIYWLDGLIPMAWQLNNEELKEKCRYYVNILLERQWENGWICPEHPDDSPSAETESFKYSDFSEGWAMFGILKVLVQYYEAEKDERVISAIEKALRFMEMYVDRFTIRNWGANRWSEGLISIYWLYERTHEPWLLQLALKIKCQGFDFITFYENEDLWPYDLPLEQCHWSFFNHVVNSAMAIKSGPLFYRLSKKESDFKGAEKMLSLIDKHHGLVTEMFSGDENFAGNSPIQGTEHCAVSEFMYSLENVFSVTGETKYIDRLEKVAFNNLAAMFDKEMRNHQCVQQINQVQCSKEEWPVYTTLGSEANLFGVEPGSPCCTTQTQGWPKFVQNIFMQAENGIAVVSYVPSVLETEKDGVKVKINIDGNYPFRDNVKITVSSEKECSFALYLRIPSWAKGAHAVINEEKIEAASGEFLVLDRLWEKETVVSLNMPSEIMFQKRPNDLFAVTKGALVYSLSIESKWVKQNKSEAKEKPWLNNFEVFPISDWNFAFLKDSKIEFFENDTDETVFDKENPPVEIHINAKKIAWEMEQGAAKETPSMEWISEKEEKIKLIPFGCTDLRMTEMPMI